MNWENEVRRSLPEVSSKCVIEFNRNFLHPKSLLNPLPQRPNTDMMDPKSHSSVPQQYHTGTQGTPVPGGFPQNPSSSNPVSAWIQLGAQAVTSEKESAAGKHRSCLPRNRMLAGHAGSPVCLLVSIPARASSLLFGALQEPYPHSVLCSHLPPCPASLGDFYDVSSMCLIQLQDLFCSSSWCARPFPSSLTKFPFYLFVPTKTHIEVWWPRWWKTFKKDSQDLGSQAAPSL